MIELSQPNLSKIEKKLILKVLNSKKLVDGIFQDMVEKKIKNMIKSNYVAVTQSCSSALEIAAILLKLKPKDEVLVPSFTFTSTHFAISSTWPCTRCPSNLPPIFIALSRLKTSPFLRFFNADLSKVSFTAVTVWQFFSISTTVRQTPL